MEQISSWEANRFSASHKIVILDTVYRVVKEALVTRGNMLNVELSSDFCASL
jgi:hypothetical protein